jgi:hypothetical protein
MKTEPSLTPASRPYIPTYISPHVTVAVTLDHIQLSDMTFRTN